MSHTEKDLLLLKHWCHLMLTQKHLQQWMLTVTFKIIHRQDETSLSQFYPFNQSWFILTTTLPTILRLTNSKTKTTNYQVLQFQFILTINVILYFDAVQMMTQNNSYNELFPTYFHCATSHVNIENFNAYKYMRPTFNILRWLFLLLKQIRCELTIHSFRASFVCQ